MASVTSEMLRSARDRHPPRFEDEQLFSTYLSGNPKDAWAYYYYGVYLDDLHYQKRDLGREQEVIEYLVKALEIGLGKKYSGALSKIYNKLGYNYFRSKKWPEALDALTTYFKIAPEQYIPAWAYRYRAKSLVRVKGVDHVETLKQSFQCLQEAIAREKERRGSTSDLVGTRVANEIYQEVFLLLDSSLFPGKKYQEALAILSVLHDYTGKLGMEAFLPDIWWKTGICNRESGNRKGEKESYENLLETPGISEGLSSDIKKLVKYIEENKQDSIDSLNEKLKALESEGEHNITELEKLREKISVMKDENARMADLLTESRDGAQAPEVEKKINAFFGVHIHNCPKMVITCLRTAETTFNSFRSYPHDLDGFPVTGSYQKALEKLIEDIITTPFRKYCQKQKMTSSPSKENRNDTFLFNIYRWKHTLSIGKLLSIYDDRHRSDKSRYLSVFYEAINRKLGLQELMQNNGFWNKLKDINNKGVFGEGRHLSIVPMRDLEKVRYSLVGDYKSQDCIIYTLVELHSAV